jgi:hypothetical protein
MVELREMLIGVIFTAIAVIVSLAVYPMIHNAVDPAIRAYNASGSLVITGWTNTSPLTAGETAMINIIPLLTCAAIALTPLSLLYFMSKQS